MHIYVVNDENSRFAISLAQEHCSDSRWSIIIHDMQLTEEYLRAKQFGVDNLPAFVIGGKVAHSGKTTVEDIKKMKINDWILHV